MVFILLLHRPILQLQPKPESISPVMHKALSQLLIYYSYLCSFNYLNIHLFLFDFNASCFLNQSKFIKEANQYLLTIMRFFYLMYKIKDTDSCGNYEYHNESVANVVLTYKNLNSHCAVDCSIISYVISTF